MDTLELLADSRERMLAYGELAEYSRLKGAYCLAAHADRLSAKYRDEWLELLLHG